MNGMEVAMSDLIPAVHACRCRVCKDGTNAAIMTHYHQLNLLLSRLNEPQRRWFVATLSQAPETPGDRELARITGLDEKTIRRGRHEMEYELRQVPVDRQRKEGGGVSLLKKKTAP